MTLPPAPRTEPGPATQRPPPYTRASASTFRSRARHCRFGSLPYRPEPGSQTWAINPAQPATQDPAARPPANACTPCTGTHSSWLEFDDPKEARGNVG